MLVFLFLGCEVLHVRLVAVNHNIHSKTWPFFLISDPISAVLLVAKRSQIIADWINRRPPMIHPIVSGASIVTVDFDKATSRIYWADAADKKIWSAYQNGTDWKEVRKQKRER